MKNMPLVSIIIPVYNGKNYLKEAIESALAQTYPNCEILVVNDGSRDGGATEEIALAYGKRIRYFHKENGGVATALNMGIREMKGDYFSWLSHDDLYHPQKIQREIETLAQRGDMTRIIYEDYEMLDAETGLKTPVRLHCSYDEALLEKSVFPVLQGAVYGCAMLIHKSHFLRVGFFDEALKATQDDELFFRLFYRQNIIYLPEILTVSRLHSNQGTKTIMEYDNEREMLFRQFLLRLTKEDAEELYGSLYMWYQRVCVFFKGGRMEKSYRFAARQLIRQSLPENTHERLCDLKNYLAELSQKKADKVCIFCAGERGLRLFYDLKSRLIHVDCFCDNDLKKHGYIASGTSCISFSELERQKESTLVIVSALSSAEVIKQLKDKAFPYVTTKAELDKILFITPPLKWFYGLECLENIDYSTDDIRFLTEQFRDVLFDICRYYEDRLSKFENKE